jgi:hypothetical protein
MSVKTIQKNIAALPQAQIALIFLLNKYTPDNLHMLTMKFD